MRKPLIILLFFLSGCNTVTSEVSSSSIADKRFIGTFGISQNDCNLKDDPNQLDWIFNVSEDKMITERDEMYFYCDFINGKYLNPNKLQANFSCVNANLLDKTQHTILLESVSENRINIVYPKTKFSPGKINELVRCSSTQNRLVPKDSSDTDDIHTSYRNKLLGKNMYEEVDYNNLRMIAKAENGDYTLQIFIASGFADFHVTIDIEGRDFNMIKSDKYRAALLQAALHRPFQLQETALNESEQRYYLDKILHADESEVATFLTKLNQGQAHGAISNMLRITSDRDMGKLYDGDWFY